MSEAHSPPRTSAYLDALSQAIHKKLQRALANSSQRRNLLQELFADIALEVDDRAKDIIVNKEEDVISPAEDINDGPLCFYDVLADYFVRVSESEKPILDLIVQLWSQSFASHIFALLFHKWSKVQNFAQSVPVQEHLCSSPRFFTPNITSSTTP